MVVEPPIPRQIRHPCRDSSNDSNRPEIWLIQSKMAANHRSRRNCDSVPGKIMKILIAEDKEIARRILERDLNKLGYETEAVADGAAAWRRLLEQPFRMVISDWEMPGMNGVELVRRIREMNSDEYVYVILLTGRTDKRDLIEGMDAGADDFITKPFELEELRVRLRSAQRLLDLEHSMARQKRELEEWKQRVKEDLDAASAIQQASLPTTLPESPGLRFAWRYQPCNELGGDTLGIVQLDETYVGFYVVDVSGHGVRAALLSVMLSRILSANSGSVLRQPADNSRGYRIMQPGEVAAILNERFKWNDHAGQFFTMFYGLLNTATSELCYTIAGHPNPLLLSSNAEARILEGDGYAIGLTTDVEFVEHRLQLCIGDRLIVFSDGLHETFAEDGQQLGVDGLVRFWTGHRQRPLDDAVALLITDLERWRGGTLAHDDLSLVGLDVEARPESPDHPPSKT